MSAYNIKWSPLGAEERAKKLKAWLPDGYSRIFKLYVFGPSDFWTMAPLRYAAKFDPFLSLDCARVEGGSNFAIWPPWLKVFREEDSMEVDMVKSAPGDMSMPSDFVRSKWAEKVYNFRSLSSRGVLEMYLKLLS